MSTPLHALLSGTFTSDGTAHFLSLPSGYDQIELLNMTDIGSTDASTPVMKARGTSDMPAGYAYVSLKTTSQATIALESGIVANGFTFVSDTAGLAIGASVAITGLSNAISPVVLTGTPPAVGQVVRLYNVTGALQMGGMDYSVTAVNPGTSMTLGDVATAPGSVGTGGSYRVVNSDLRYYPRWRYISGITAATSAVISTTVDHGYVAGQQVRIYVSSSYGMSQINGLSAEITSVTHNTITVNLDSSAFTAFAYPASATAALGVQFPIVVPIGEAAVSPYQNSLSDAKYNQSQTGVWIGTSVQTTAKVYQWIARAGVSV